MQTAKYIYNDAILVQNAVNPSGVLNSLIQAVYTLEEDNPNAGAAILEHPAVLLMYYAWLTLVRRFDDYDPHDWAVAYNIVEPQSDYYLTLPSETDPLGGRIARKATV